MSIRLENLCKWYGSQAVVDQVSLEVGEGELFVLLGTSGSGKTTVLRMIAGLASADSGRILINDMDVTDLPAQKRGAGFVFQNYSIFRHMNVAENIEFGLKIRKIPREERRRKCAELLDLVGLAGLGYRFVEQLSGGQQQRVAVARALAYEPSVLLLDEPFGALDVKIRAQLRRNLKNIQKRLGITTILVTHDQDEAFELADRIGVIERGRLLEIGVPEKLYTRPESSFVATFLGAGTVLTGRAAGGQALFGSLSLPIPSQVAHEEGARVRVLIRPENVILSAHPPAAPVPILGRGSVIEQSFSGTMRRIRVRLPHLAGTRQIAPPLPFGEEGLLVDVLIPSEHPLPCMEPWVSLQSWHIIKPAQRRLLCYSGGKQSGMLPVVQKLANALNASITLLDVEDDANEKASSLNSPRQHLPTGQMMDRGELRLRYGQPAEQILGEQAEILYTMLILSAADLPGSRADRLNPVLGRVLQNADMPILIIKDERASLDRFLIATDAGEAGIQDVQFGGWLARLLGAKVTLLFASGSDLSSDPRIEAHLERASATLRALDLPNEVRKMFGVTPADGILSEVKTGEHNLIVLGHHQADNRSGSSERMDLLSQVLLHAESSILVVPI